MDSNEFVLFKTAYNEHSHHGAQFSAHRRRAMGFKPHDYTPIQRNQFKRQMKRQQRQYSLTGYRGGF